MILLGFRILFCWLFGFFSAPFTRLGAVCDTLTHVGLRLVLWCCYEVSGGIHDMPDNTPSSACACERAGAGAVRSRRAFDVCEWKLYQLDVRVFSWVRDVCMRRPALCDRLRADCARDGGGELAVQQHEQRVQHELRLFVLPRVLSVGLAPPGVHLAGSMDRDPPLVLPRVLVPLHQRDVRRTRHLRLQRRIQRNTRRPNPVSPPVLAPVSQRRRLHSPLNVLVPRGNHPATVCPAGGRQLAER